MTTYQEWWRPKEPAAPAATSAAASPVPFAALIAFTFVLLLAPQNYVPILSVIRIALLMAFISVASHAYDRLRRRQPLTIVTAEIRITAYILAWALATLPFSYWPGGSVALLLDLYLKTLVVFMLIANTVNSKARLRIVALALSLMAIPIAFSGVNAFLSGVYISDDSTQSVNRIIGYEGALTKNPNDLALILNLIIPLTLALIFTVKQTALRLVLLAAFGLQVVGVVITFSRAGFLSLVSIFAAYFWAVRKRRERTWAYAGIVLLVAALPMLPGSYLTRLSTITNIEADATGSAQNRHKQQVAAVHYVLAHPIIAAGIGMNVLALQEEMGDWLYIHNVFLQYAADLGFPGLILYVCLLVTTFRTTHYVQRRTANAPEHRDLFFLAVGIQTSLVAFTISAFFSPVAYHFQFYYFAGLATALRVVYDRLAPASTEAGGSIAGPS
jgi:O-antigen ligase